MQKAAHRLLAHRDPQLRELIAQRLVRYARAVGRENVVAGTDCGLGNRTATPGICWAKLNAMAEGAKLASRVLWGR